jgi:ubiquinone/menaquinone biosynthesis C-methylase UbiE
MDRLTNAEELLDGPLDDPATLAGNLRDLRRINRLLGGVRLSRLAVDKLLTVAPTHLDDSPISIIDVGTGGADIPVALLADARRRGRTLEVMAVDSRREVLLAARAARPAIDRFEGLELRVSDGRSLSHPDRAFDIAHASLVVHHLEPDQAVALLAEMARVARLGIVINDLDRGRIHWVGAWLIAHLMTGNRYTRHDAPMSVLRAYRRREMRELLTAAGLRPVGEFGGFFGHRYAIAAIRA